MWRGESEGLGGLIVKIRGVRVVGLVLVLFYYRGFEGLNLLCF